MQFLCLSVSKKVLFLAWQGDGQMRTCMYYLNYMYVI